MNTINISTSINNLNLKKGEIENFYLNKGYTIVGVDEVGRGCIAGDVYVGAVVCNYDKLYKLSDTQKELIKDSKQLSAKKRVEAIPVIKDIADSYAISSATIEEIEKYGIVNAIFIAFKKALSSINMNYDLVMVDGKQKIKDLDKNQVTVVKGDSLCYCIAAASILAKVTRDSYMKEQAKIYPNYGFEKHVGYGTKYHIEQLKKWGVSSIHRKNFEPVSSMIKIKDESKTIIY